jgi:hypothetical protein
MRKPDFFIVGAPKCGTTALYRCLQEHPEIFVPPNKEIHYFGTDLYSPTYLRNSEQYLNLFADAKTEKRVGEASVWYLYSKRSASEIKNFCPDARIIIMLRNPADMIHSLHSQRLFIGSEDLADFEEALNAEEDRKAGRRLPKFPYLVEGLFYREVGKYSEQVRRYLNTFAPDRVKVIIFDDFNKAPAETYRETFEFLNVDRSFEPQVRVVNANKQVRSKALRSLLDNPPTLLRKVVRPITTQSFRHRLFRAGREMNTKYVPRVPMRAELRRELQRHFAEDVKKLSEILHRDLTHWSDP